MVVRLLRPDEDRIQGLEQIAFGIDTDFQRPLSVPEIGRRQFNQDGSLSQLLFGHEDFVSPAHDFNLARSLPMSRSSPECRARSC